MGQLGPQSQHLDFVLLAGGDVHAHAQHANRSVPRRPLHSPARGNPPLAAIGQHDAILGGVVRPLVQRPPQGLPGGLSIFGMQVLEERLHRDGLTGREAEHRVEPLGGPHRVLRSGPDPEAEVGSIRGQGHLLLAFAQVVRESRGAEHVVAQLVAHHRDQAQEEQARRERRMDDSPQHQHGLERCSRPRRTRCFRPPPAPAAGHPSARPRERRPRRRSASNNRLSGPTSIQGLGTPSATETVSPRNGRCPQRGDLPVVQIRRRTEIEQQEPASSRRRPSRPATTAPPAGRAARTRRATRPSPRPARAPTATPGRTPRASRARIIRSSHPA